MNAKIRPIMDEYIQKLKTIYKDALQSVILYGSYARGDEAESSDIDVLILVNIDEQSLRAKNEALVCMTYDFNMEHGTDIEPIAESVKTYHYWLGAHPFYQNVRREGVVLYDAA